MHFPPAQAELYDGPRSEWLYDILRRVPYLQSLVVSHIPFFDYSSLSSLVKLSQPSVVHTSLSTYQLRLLEASDCNNATPQSLAAALKLFPGLVYLDVSGTVSARYNEALMTIANLPALQILKLQRLGITDDSLVYLIRSAGRKLRSLDLRYNRITDRGVQYLVQDALQVDVRPANARSTSTRVGTETQQILTSEQQEAYVRKRLTSGFVSDLGIEAGAGNGITHLYVSNNQITFTGASTLLRCERLQVLDIGSLSSATTATPKPQHLTSIIEEGMKQLTYLRLNHAIITEKASSKKAKSFEVEDTSDLALPSNIAELELSGIMPREISGNPIHEAAGAIPPIYAELEGSPVRARSSRPVIATSQNHTAIPSNMGQEGNQLKSTLNPVLDSCGGLFSPVSLLAPMDVSHGVNAGPRRHLTVPGTTSLPEVVATEDLEVDTECAGRRQATRLRSYSGVQSDHKARTRFRQSQDHSLLAAAMGEIRALVLTDVPAKSSSRAAAENIISFIKDCAEEERWAALEAAVGYQLPPGPDRRSAELYYARTLFPFRKLVLEMAAEVSPSYVTGKGRSFGKAGGVVSNMLSSTLDPDCESYLNAAKDDFSFFASEECGQPDTEGTAPIPLVAFQEKMSIEPYSTNENAGEGNSIPNEQIYDVLAEVSQFRRLKKADHEAALAQGENHVDGYWSGVIEVVRPRA